VGMYLDGYIVDSVGNITLPLVGKVYAKGSTLDALHERIDKKIGLYFKEFSTDVKLLNFTVSVLGDVKVPGTFNIYRENMTVLDVIAMAKGLEIYADRKKVILIRNNDFKVEKQIIDLTNDEFIGTKYYYVKPGDVIYVNQLRSKALKNNVGLISVVVSGLSLLALIYYNSIR